MNVTLRCSYRTVTLEPYSTRGDTRIYSMEMGIFFGRICKVLISLSESEYFFLDMFLGNRDF